MTPKELREMPTHVRNGTLTVLTAKSLYGALPWLVIIDHKVEEDKPQLRATILVWAQDECDALKLAGSQARGGEIKSIDVVDPTQNLNTKKVALVVTLPINEKE